MFDSFLAHSLVLLLLLISGLRVFFIANPRVDSVAVLPPIAFLASLVVLFVWGVTPQALLVSAVALLFMLTNVRALFRLSAELIVDDYSALFKVVTVLELLVAAAAAALVFWTRPVRCVPKDFGVERTVRSLTGNFASGFRVIGGYADRLRGADETGTLTVYAPSEKIVWENRDGSLFNSLAEDATFVDVVEEFERGKPAEVAESSDSAADSAKPPAVAEPAESADSPEVVEELENEYAALPLLLFVGTAHAPSEFYEPYFLFLAQKGFTVLAADFYPPEAALFEGWRSRRMFRRSTALTPLIDGESPEEEGERILSRELELKSLGYVALADLAVSENPDAPLFFLTEGLNMDALAEISSRQGDSVAGFFSLNGIDEYRTVGYGFVEQTDVILARLLGADRDGEFFIPRYAAFKTLQSVDRMFAAYKASRRERRGA